MTKRAELDRMADERTCFVCLDKIPEREGVYDMSLRILVHQKPCGDTVNREHKDFTRSKRGHFRTPADTRRRLEALRPAGKRPQVNQLPDPGSGEEKWPSRGH